MTGDEIRSAQFIERWRGYAPAAVDEVLDRLAKQLDRGERLDANELERLQFPTRFRGYDQQQVDEVLARLRADIS